LIEVKVRRGQSIEKAISIFKKKVKDSKILYELREREYYMKPSLIKKEKKAKAKARRKRQSFDWFFQFLYTYIKRNTLLYYSIRLKVYLKDK